MSQSIEPRLAARIANAVYALAEKPTIEDAITDMNVLFNGSLTFHKSNLLKGKTGGPGFIKVRTAFGFVLEGKKQLEGHTFVVFRGTKYLADWLSNANVTVGLSNTGRSVHQGFMKAFQSMLPQLREFTGQLSNGSQVHCIGHSLGGALATIAAEWLSVEKGIRPKLYTFGSPRVGLEDFASGTTKRLGSENVFRAWHKTDIVPCIPIWPFEHTPHAGKDYFLPSPGFFPGAEWHSMDLYIRSVGKKSWKVIYALREPQPADSDIRRWLADKTIVTNTLPAIKWLQHALAYVVGKCLSAIGSGYQMLKLTTSTLMDTLAWILSRGVDMTEKLSGWVVHLMRKIAEFLGMHRHVKTENPEKQLIRYLLERLSDKVNQMAKQVLSQTLADGRAI
ncbi:lipase family protein [Endozoicomonas arenosclerae]|uniref:lipase family protein n=1 Tax=Endozoicomonas arenosclerae TaxID=1633495 RepID=UPI000781461A|nr:lipase family protein [Endozoicomonas arenosclerae]